MEASGRGGDVRRIGWLVARVHDAGRILPLLGPPDLPGVGKGS